MGTPISLDLADDLPRATLDDLADGVFAWLREVDARFSTYRADSEVSRFGRGELLLTEASGDLRLVLERCADLWAATDGWFDAHATGRFDPSGCGALPDRAALADRGAAPWDSSATFLVLTGTDLAVATSGVYERGHHVLDPRRGGPARGLRAVTVVGLDLGVADAYATVAVAMGTAGTGWLDRLAGYEHAVVTDTGRCRRSPRLPVD